MLNLEELKNSIPHIDFREKRSGLYKVLIPHFYEDGDMYDVFLENSPINSEMIRLSDYGLTLMKLSYTFNVNSKTKANVLQNIISQNRCFFDNGNIFLDIYPTQFSFAIYQFIQTITKVSNMNILSRENIKSMFFEHLNDFIFEQLKDDYKIKINYIPIIDDPDICVDYVIESKKPIFLYGVNSNDKASKVIISCLNFISKKINFHSLIVCENADELSKFYQKRLMNVVDKQYYDLSSFKELGVGHISRNVLK